MSQPIINESKPSKAAKKVNSFLMKKLGWYGVLVVAAVYLFWGFFKPDLNDRSIIETLLSSSVSMLVALSISNLLGAQGIINGHFDSDVVEMKRQHIAKVEEANEFVEYSDEWSDEENTLALKTARKHILMSAGLKYEEFFNESGDFLEKYVPEPSKKAHKYIKKRYANKMAAIKKALTYQITPVSMSRLSAETTVNLDPNRLEPEPTEYQKAKAVKSFWQKILSVAVFGKITWSLIEGANFWQSIFNGVIQLVVFLLFGIISFYGSYTYMTNTYVGNLRKKINLLSRLIVFGKKSKAKEEKAYGESRRNTEEAANAGTTNETVPATTSNVNIPTGAKSTSGTTQTEPNGISEEQKSTIGTVVFNKPLY